MSQEPSPQNQEPALTLASLAIYTLSRLVGLNLLLLAVQQTGSERMAAGLPFRLWHNAVSRWDVYYYQAIATNGYPRVLPMGADGAVVPNTWAFFPLFPFTAHVVDRITGFGFDVSAILVNLTAGALAAVFLAKIVASFSNRATALRAVALWAFFPTAFVLQIPYAEAVYLACASGCLLALRQRRYGIASAWLLAATCSRGYILPLSAAALCRVWLDARERRSALETNASAPRATASAARGLAASAMVAPFLWIIVSALVTGRADAYAATQQAWGYSFDALLSLDRWQNAIARDAMGVLTGAPMLTLASVLATTIAAWRGTMPVELKVYAVVAAVFLLAIAQPGAVAFASVPRFAFGIVTIPITLAALVRRRPALAGVLASFTILQYLWISNIWSGRLGFAP